MSSFSSSSASNPLFEMDESISSNCIPSSSPSGHRRPHQISIENSRSSNTNVSNRFMSQSLDFPSLENNTKFEEDVDSCCSSTMRTPSENHHHHQNPCFSSSSSALALMSRSFRQLRRPSAPADVSPPSRHHFQCAIDVDLRALQQSVFRSARLLQDSGYRSLYSTFNGGGGNISERSSLTTTVASNVGIDSLSSKDNNVSASMQSSEMSSSTDSGYRSLYSTFNGGGGNISERSSLTTTVASNVGIDSLSSKDNNVSASMQSSEMSSSTVADQQKSAGIYLHRPPAQKASPKKRQHYRQSNKRRSAGARGMPRGMHKSASASCDNPVGTTLPEYGTGWMIVDTLSATSCSDDEQQHQEHKSSIIDGSLPVVAGKKLTSLLLTSSGLGSGGGFSSATKKETAFQKQQDFDDRHWDGVMEVDLGAGGKRKMKIRQMAELLATQFAYISGTHTESGNHPVIVFPDIAKRVPTQESGSSAPSPLNIDFDQYQLLVSYLVGIVRVEDPSASISSGFAIIIDRRTDKWANVRLLINYLTSYFPEHIHVVFLLKPEGVFQRALEGYKSLFSISSSVDNQASSAPITTANTAMDTKFKIIVCQGCGELAQYIGGGGRNEQLSTDLGGTLCYDHAKWVHERMEIERLKSSASVIAQSLAEFGRALRETELPNDAQTTERVLDQQSADRDAIKEDFRIAVRKGYALLQQIRQYTQQNRSEQTPHPPPPMQLQNVTAVERMLVQLQDTERSFDNFWLRHRKRLLACCRLRRFEETFRKLQSSFAHHMIYLEEHRSTGDSVQSAKLLSVEHSIYSKSAEEDVKMAQELRDEGLRMADEEEELEAVLNSDSLAPKCEELQRMADALHNALERRATILQLSQRMHAQISQATNWCRQGVEILTLPSMDVLVSNNNSKTDRPKISPEQAISKLDQFLEEGETLRLDALNGINPSSTDIKTGKKIRDENLALLTTTETSCLLAQVANRIEDIRKLSLSRRQTLQRIAMEQKKSLDSDTPSPANGQASGNKGSRRPVQVVPPKKASPTSGKSTDDNSLSKCSSDNPQQQSDGEIVENSNKKDGMKNQNFAYRQNENNHLLWSDGQSASSTGAGDRVLSSMDSPVPVQQHASTSRVSSPNSTKVRYIVDELLTTERTYLRDLKEISKFYIDSFEKACASPEAITQLPPPLRGRSSQIFGNIRDLIDLHQQLLVEMDHSDGINASANALIGNRERMLNVYRQYCRNKPDSEQLRSTHQVDHLRFFVDCQRQAGHLLPLSAYLLKPIQRVTKYQLLLRELLLNCPEEERHCVEAALQAVLQLLAQLNADMQMLHILNYPGELKALGPLRLQAECDVYIFKRPKGSSISSSSSSNSSTNGAGTANSANSRPRVSGKPQRRHAFLFDGGFLLCKRRPSLAQSFPGGNHHSDNHHHSSIDGGAGSALSMAMAEYFDYKLCIPANTLGFAKESCTDPDRFDVWDRQTKSGLSDTGYAISLIAPACAQLGNLEVLRTKWRYRLSRLTQQQLQPAVIVTGAELIREQPQKTESCPPPEPPNFEENQNHHAKQMKNRPHSWTSVASSEGDGTTTSSETPSSSCCSTSIECVGGGDPQRGTSSCCAVDEFCHHCSSQQQTPTPTGCEIHRNGGVQLIPKSLSSSLTSTTSTTRTSSFTPGTNNVQPQQQHRSWLGRRTRHSKSTSKTGKLVGSTSTQDIYLLSSSSQPDNTKCGTLPHHPCSFGSSNGNGVISTSRSLQLGDQQLVNTTTNEAHHIMDLDDPMVGRNCQQKKQRKQKDTKESGNRRKYTLSLSAK